MTTNQPADLATLLTELARYRVYEVINQLVANAEKGYAQYMPVEKAKELSAQQHRELMEYLDIVQAIIALKSEETA